MTLSKPERERIRMMFGGRCAYCGCLLGEKGWSPDHVEPVVRFVKYMRTSDPADYRTPRKRVLCMQNPGNDRVDNLYPACRACNINKSSMTLEQWRKFLTNGPESLASYNGRFKHMLRFKIVVVNPDPFQFWFEKYRALR